MDYTALRHSDFEWFEDNTGALYRRYGEAYVVIQNKKVIGVYSDCPTAVKETLKKEPEGSFIVQLCGKDKESLYGYLV